MANTNVLMGSKVEEMVNSLDVAAAPSVDVVMMLETPSRNAKPWVTPLIAVVMVSGKFVT